MRVLQSMRDAFSLSSGFLDSISLLGTVKHIHCKSNNTIKFYQQFIKKSALKFALPFYINFRNFQLLLCFQFVSSLSVKSLSQVPTALICLRIMLTHHQDLELIVLESRDYRTDLKHKKSDLMELLLVTKFLIQNLVFSLVLQSCKWGQALYFQHGFTFTLLSRTQYLVKTHGPHKLLGLHSRTHSPPTPVLNSVV